MCLSSYSYKGKNQINSFEKMEKGQSKGDNASSSNRPLSIQAPPTSSNVLSQQTVRNQPRQPSDLQGLLRFTMEATKNENASHQSAIQTLDEEKKQFLNNALESLTVNVTEELHKAVKLLSNVMELRAEEDPSEYEKSLETIADYVGNMDIANDFYKIGGFSVLGPCLNSPHDNIRWRVSDVIAELTQNNLYCQDKILEMGLLPILLAMVDTDLSEQTRIKSLYAVSCIVRGNCLALKYMEINDGYSILIRAMQTSIEKLQVKSAFLLSALCNEDKAHALRSTLIKMGLIEQAAGLLAMSNIIPDTRDCLLSILDSLSTNNNLQALQECRRPELCLNKTLNRHLKNLKAEEAMDEVELCNSLLDRIFADYLNEQDR